MLTDLIGKHRVGLNELLGVALVEPLQDEGAHAAARAAGHRVAHHEALKAVTPLGRDENNGKLVSERAREMVFFRTSASRSIISKTSCKHQIGRPNG
jgi:hypothetical protein